MQSVTFNKTENSLSFKLVGMAQRNDLIRFQSKYLKIILLRKYLYKNNSHPSLKFLFHPLTG
jgi:hypothetical protein